MMESPAHTPLESAHLAELIGRCASGDDQAVQLLLMHYHGRLLGFLRRKVGVDWQGKIDAEDILQEGYVKVFAGIKDFQPNGEDSFYHWATRILDHTFVDHVRALRRKKRDVLRESAQGINEVSEERRQLLLDKALQHSLTASRIMRRDDALAAMMACMAKLPEDYRLVVRRHFLDEESFRSIAVDLGRSEDAVRRLAGRAVEQLGQCLGSASHFLSMRS